MEDVKLCRAAKLKPQFVLLFDYCLHQDTAIDKIGQVNYYRDRTKVLRTTRLINQLPTQRRVSYTGIVERSVSVSVKGAWCTTVLRGAYSSAYALVAAHISQTSLEQYPPERSSEVLVEDGVNDRVQRRIHVPQPEGGRECEPRYLNLQSEYVHEKERQPACDERPHNQPQDQRRSLFLLPRDSPLLPLGIPRLLHLRNNVLYVSTAHTRPFVPILRGPTAEYRFTQSQLKRFHDGTTRHHTGIGTAGVELAHHVGVYAHGGLAGAGQCRRLLLQFPVHREGGTAELARGEAGALGSGEHLETEKGKLSRGNCVPTKRRSIEQFFSLTFKTLRC